MQLLPAAAAANSPDAPPACAATVLPGTRCPDTAYRRTAASDWQACCATCGADLACGAFVFDTGDRLGRRCHLKHNVTITQPSPGITCGFFPGKGTAPPCPLLPGPPPPPPAPPSPPSPSAPWPHLVFLLQDDLGFDDVGWNNPENRPQVAPFTHISGPDSTHSLRPCCC